MDKIKARSELWDKNSEVLKTLRIPKSLSYVTDNEELTEKHNEFIKYDELSNSFNHKEQRRHNVCEDVVAKSTLKVDAPEWYPSTHIFKNSIQTIVSGKNMNDVNILKKCEVGKVSNFLHQPFENYEDSLDIIRLKQIISTLTKDPGQFDNLLDIFMETLQPYFEDIMFLSVIAQVLVVQAIDNSNFRYTGAKLCWWVEQNCPKFRAELYLKCKKQLEENTNKQNVLLFIAELYTQLPHLTIYGVLLIDCYIQLLAEGGNENIKCICQALKLTGHSLEYSNKAALDEVFIKLKLAKESVNKSVNNLVDYVANLRCSNWGYSVETSTEAEEDLDTLYYEDYKNTTFYHSDGKTFTTEEKEFLTVHLDPNLQYFSDNSDPDDLCDPEPEMDAEIQAAFKEFVKLSKH